jgi:poly-beta-1,6-N-acetyl-D-glucosamine synthase
MKWAFWVSVIVIAYTYVGYLGWLWLRSRLRPKPVQWQTFQPFVSIVMVVRNEERVLHAKIENLLTLDYKQEQTELVIVSDGSTDATDAILHEQASNPRVVTLLNQMSRGKASGLNDALQVVRGDIVVFTDARQKIESGALQMLVNNFADPQVGCVSGELMLGDPSEKSRGMGLYWTLEKKVRELESASGSVVGATGSFYAVRRELLGTIHPEILLDDVYIPMEVVRRGKRVLFEPRARAWDVANQGTVKEFSRKVRTLSGNYQLLQFAPWLLSAANPIRFEFVCHKLLRLMVPFALLMALLGSAFLSQPFYQTMFVLQLAFYALSVVRMSEIRLGPLARLGDVSLTFVVLNVAAVVAFANFVTQRKVAWSR